MGRLIGFASLVCALSLCLWSARADEKTRFHLKNGDIVTGKVLEQKKNGSILIDTGHGRLLLPKNVIRLKEKVVVKKPAIRKSPRKKRPDNSVDKQTLQQIQATLKRIETAVNKGQARALRAALNSAPGVEDADLAALKSRLGLSRVALKAYNGRKLGDRVRVTVTVEQSNGKGDNHKTVSGENFSFRRQGTAWKLVLEHKSLGRRLGLLSTFERAALKQLKKIHLAQLAFRKRGAIDLDDDRKGEFGFLQELAGISLRKGKQGKRKPIAALIDPAFGASLVKHKRYATLGGYNFLIYLPGDNKPIAEKGPLESWLPVNANRAEQYYICYAWPSEYGKTGQRAFVLYHKGQIYFTMNGGVYSGATAPVGQAAFPADAEDPNNLISDSIGGNPAWDELVWLKVGTPFARPLPRGIHLIDRLLLARNIFPDGPIKRQARAAAPAKAPKLSRRSKRFVRQAQRELQDLYIALRSFRSKRLRFPPSGRRSLVIYLDGNPKNGGDNESYYVFLPNRIKNNTFLDPWGRPYLYRAPKQQGADPLVWSVGPNGKDEGGKGDDVASGK